MLRLAFVAYAASISLAFAQQHVHPDATYEGEIARFYETWMRPDDVTKSCCNKMDCAPSIAHYDRLSGKWSAWSKRSNGWIAIPSDKIERQRDMPLGAHLCEAPSGVLCFGVGSGT